MRLMHHHRYGALPAAPIRLARPAIRAAPSSLRRTRRDWRRLSRTRAGRGFRFVFHSRILAFQARRLSIDAGSIGFRSMKVATQPRISPPEFLDCVRGLVTGGPAHGASAGSRGGEAGS